MFPKYWFEKWSSHLEKLNGAFSEYCVLFSPTEVDIKSDGDKEISFRTIQQLEPCNGKF